MEFINRKTFLKRHKGKGKVDNTGNLRYVTFPQGRSPFTSDGNKQANGDMMQYFMDNPIKYGEYILRRVKSGKKNPKELKGYAKKCYEKVLSHKN